MNIVRLHDWHVTTSRAIQIQTEMAGQVSRTGDVNPELIAGVDISVDRLSGTGTGAVVVLSYPGLDIVEVQVVTDRIEFPYVPGLLSFREAPLVLAACEKLAVKPDLFIVDGQGIAHPRRIGLASHLGLFWDKPTIGCAKSRLCGTHELPGDNAKSYTQLIDKDDVVGAVLRTRTGVKPVYVSIGHKIGLASAINWVLACCRGYRLPEPTRLAHQAAGGNLKAGSITAYFEMLK
ncbi:MAG TPA: deoxyribonuclease V [Dehalococcoidia bacterium]|nr:deoxyribonuclease V [Dehalococcoidia bacterium]